MLTELLDLDFSHNAALVYQSLVEIGYTSAGDIIKKTGLHRNIVYTELDRLIHQKLAVKVTRNKINYYQITDPEILLEKAEKHIERTKALLPKIQKIQDQKPKQFLVYEGVRSMKAFILNSIENQESNSVLYYAFEMGEAWTKILSKDFDTWNSIRIKKKIKAKGIVAKGKGKVQVPPFDKLHQIRAVTLNQKITGNFNIWEDRVILQDFEEPQSIMEIQNANMAKTFKQYFEVMWQSGKNIKV